MEHIYSKLKTETLLHVVIRKDDINRPRINLVAKHHPLQCGLISIDDEGKTYPAHEHQRRSRCVELTQEAWVVVEGRAVVTYYDLNGTELGTATLEPGDCSITLRGGHGYEIPPGEPTKVYEFKTGPYLGQARDKIIYGEPNDSAV